MSQLRLIGDVHGRIDQYKKLLKGCEYSLQIGDLGFNYEYQIDAERHKFFGGNHDNYDVIKDSPNCLGDFGVWEVPDFGPIFWVRGGWSIDHESRSKHDRQIGQYFFPKNFWEEEEEMTVRQCQDALDLYKEVKPKLLVSHECPINIVQHVTNPKFAENFGYTDSIIKTKTNQLLQAMTDFSPPQLHFFGHYHCGFSSFADGKTGRLYLDNEYQEGLTRYVCIDILKVVDLPRNFVNEMDSDSLKAL